MKRRNFLRNLLATGSFAGMAPYVLGQTTSHNQERNRQYYELKKYILNKPRQLEMVNSYLSGAYIPALNRMGIEPVGVFREMNTLDHSFLYVVIPYNGFKQFHDLKLNLQNDQTYRKEAENYLETGANEPAYQRIESSFMIAFKEHPNLIIPKAAKTDDKRIFELRIYESYSEYKGHQKVKMFNEGEIEIFIKTGLDPVFFGKTLIGDKLPNLTYMLTFDNMKERDVNWNAFINHPQWVKMSKDPQYKDTVSNITQVFLEPLEYSQI